MVKESKKIGMLPNPIAIPHLFMRLGKRQEGFMKISERGFSEPDLVLIWDRAAKTANQLSKNTIS